MNFLWVALGGCTLWVQLVEAQEVLVYLVGVVTQAEKGAGGEAKGGLS